MNIGWYTLNVRWFIGTYPYLKEAWKIINIIKLIKNIIVSETLTTITSLIKERS
jgi:hypothetical protein